MKTMLAMIAAACAFAADEAPPKAEAILDHFVEVTGGKAAYEKRHSKISHGVIEFVGRGIKGQVTEFERAPDKVYQVAEFEGVGQQEEGSDGEVAWEKSALQGPRVKDGTEKAQALEEATFNAPLLWRQLYTVVKTAGSEQVNGEDCWKVTGTTKQGKTETMLYSKKSGLLIKESAVQSTQMGDIPVESTMSDYKDYGGVQEPSVVRQKFAGQEMLLTLDDVKLNAEIPPAKFDLPADIQALVRKAAGGKLAIFMGGNAVATESYTMQKADGRYTWSGSGEAHLGPMLMTIENYTIVTDGQYRPLEAELKTKMGQVSREVKTTFADGKAKNETATPNGPQIKEDAVSDDALVFAYPIPVFPLSVLARKVSFANAEPQRFHAYLLAQKEVPVTVKYLGKETVEFANKKAELNHLVGTVTMQPGQEMAVDLWVTDERKIVKLTVPAQKVEVYQEGYERIPPPPPPAAPTPPDKPPANPQ